jgi:hypothetical protein
MRRDELKAEGWTIPAARAKNNRAHFLPLAPLSREIILGLPKVGDEYVFTLNGDRPIRARAKAKQRLDALMAKYLGRPVAAWQVRDLRRTTYTGLERLKFPIEVAEAVANHVSGTKEGLPGVYGKHDYSEEKAAALRAWAHHVRAVVRAMARKRA